MLQQEPRNSSTPGGLLVHAMDDKRNRKLQRTIEQEHVSPYAFKARACIAPEYAWAQGLNASSLGNRIYPSRWQACSDRSCRHRQCLFLSFHDHDKYGLVKELFNVGLAGEILRLMPIAP